MKKIAKLYDKVIGVDKRIIEKAIIIYMKTLNKSLNEILDELAKSLANTLSIERHEVVFEEAKMRQQALEKCGGYLTHGERERASKANLLVWGPKKELISLWEKTKKK